MKKTIFVILALIAYAGVALAVNHVYVYQSQTLKCEGYFPQLSPDGTKVIYAPVESSPLYIYDLEQKKRTTICSEGYPGFDAAFGPDGKVYYITMRFNENHICFRSGHEYDPANGNDRVVLANQHGAMHAINGTKGMTVVAEQKEWNSANAGTYAWALGDKLFIVKDGKKKVVTPIPVQTGYLWVSVSPDGKKILFQVPANGLFVCDTEGRIISKLPNCMMPSWYNNDLIVAQGRGKGYNFNIVMFRADGQGGIQSLANSGACQPSVSGNKVIYCSKTGTIKVLTLETPDEHADRLKREAEERKAREEEAARQKAEQERLEQEKAAEESTGNDNNNNNNSSEPY